jgi:predicted lactoylglutathione lyase
MCYANQPLGASPRFVGEEPHASAWRLIRSFPFSPLDSVMSQKMFVNLPVRDLQKSMTFFKSLGYQFNPQFTDETAACMVISEENYTMLLTHAKFAEFTSRAIADATKTTEVLVCLSCDSREQVDDIMNKALAGGATTCRPPQDYGFMYLQSFHDLDGHIWEFFWMDPSFVQKQG